MSLICEHCGYEGTRAAFKYVGAADYPGPNTLRLCPKCKQSVYCDEWEQNKAQSGVKVWGLSGLRGQTFTKKHKPTDHDDHNK